MSDGWSMVARVLRVQLLVTAGVSGAALGYDPRTAASALLGGLISCVPTAYFIYRVFRSGPGGSPDRELGAMVRAEAGKLVLAGVLLAVAFAAAEKLNVIALLATYILVQVSGSAVSLTLGSAGPAHARGGGN